MGLRLVRFLFALALVLSLAACPSGSTLGDTSNDGGTSPTGFTYTITPLIPDGGSTVDSMPRLTWNSVTDAAAHELQIGDTAIEAQAAVPISMDATPQYFFTSALTSGAPVYWRVRVQNTKGVWGDWSPVFHFTYSSTPVFVSALADGGSVSSQTPLLDWDDPPGSASHRVQIATDAAFTNIIDSNITLATSQYQMAVSIPLGSTRYWRIAAVALGSGAVSDWSAPRAFTVTWAVNWAGVTRWPVHTVSTFDRTPRLNWTTVPGAVTTAGVLKYQVQIADTEVDVGAAPVIDLTTNYYDPPQVSFGTSKWWRMRGVNVEGATSDWSPAFSYTVLGTYGITASAVNTADTTPTLDWSDAFGPTSGAVGLTYDLEVETDNTFDGAGLVTGLATSTYTISTPIPVGSSRWWRVRVLNDSGDVGAWVELTSFTMDWNDTITVVNPADGSDTLDQTSLLDWSDVAGAASYEYAIAGSALALTAAKATPSAAATSQYQITSPTGFPSGRYWAARAVNSEGVKGAWYNFSFTVTDAFTISVVRPTDGGNPAQNPPYIEWSPVTGAVSYDFQMASSSAGVSGATPVSCPSYVYFDGNTVPDGSSRFWRVRAKNDSGNTTAYTTIASFSIPWTYTITAVSPAHKATAVSKAIGLVIDWSAVTGAASYELQAATTPDLGATTPMACATHAYTTTATLAALTKYYWRARPINSEGFAGAWSSTFEFTTGP